MIRAVIFDADGPLYYRTGAVSEQKKALLARYGYHGELKKFESAYEQEKFKAYVRIVTPAEMYQTIFEIIGIHISATAARRFTDQMDMVLSQVTPTPSAASTLRALKSAGIQTCILTDSFYSSKQKRPWFEQMGLGTLFDFMISSFDTKFLKNTAEAYRACLSLMKTSPSETIFVGHQEYEMVGARKAGVRTIALTPIATPGIHADYLIDSLEELPGLLGKIT